MYPDDTMTLSNRLCLILGAAGTEDVVALADVPAAVQKTINGQAMGGRLVSVEKVVEAVKTSYEAVIEKQGKQKEITVGVGGKIGGG